MSRRTFNLKNSLQSNHNMYVDSAIIRMAAGAASPTSVLAVFDNDHIDLTWVAASAGDDPISGYKVYRGTTSGVLTLLATLGIVTNYVDSSGVSGTTYYYKVRAFDNGGLGDLSSEVNATWATIPDAPTDLTAVGQGSTIKLDWVAPVNDGGSAVTAYKIYRGTVSGSLTLHDTVGAVLTYTDSTDVSAYTTYYYAVSAVNVVGEGAQSSEANARAELLVMTETFEAPNAPSVTPIETETFEAPSIPNVSTIFTENF